MKTLAAFLLLTATAFSDSIVLKNGKSIDGWKSIVDLGDAYQVELPGSKLTVQKSEIDRIVVTPIQPPLTGATFTATPIKGKVKSYNALAAVDPKSDVFGTNKDSSIKISASAVTASFCADRPERIQIPIKVSEEYDFSLTVERKGGVSNFYVGLVVSGSPFTFSFDDDKMTKTGGKEISQPTFPERKAVTVLFQVRKNGWRLMLDGKESSSSETASSASVSSDGKAFLFFGSQKIFGTPTNSWIVSKVTLIQTE